MTNFNLDADVRDFEKLIILTLRKTLFSTIFLMKYSYKTITFRMFDQILD